MHSNSLGHERGAPFRRTQSAYQPSAAATATSRYSLSSASAYKSPSLGGTVSAPGNAADFPQIARMQQQLKTQQEHIDDHSNSLTCMMDVMDTAVTEQQVMALLDRVEQNFRQQVSELESKQEVALDQMHQAQLMAAETIDEMHTQLVRVLTRLVHLPGAVC